MAIIEFSFDRNAAPVDAQGILHGHTGSVYLDGKYETTEGPRAYWVWRTHVGLCLSDREMNGYDDSDFYMTVWDEATQSPREIMFASTRGWTYPAMGSFVDATPEVRAAYEAWQAAQNAARRVADRLAMAKARRVMRSKVRQAVGTGDSFVRAMRLRRALSEKEFNAIVKLLTANIRNSFKLSLKAQAASWFKDGGQHRTPLSPKQIACLMRYE